LDKGAPHLPIDPISDTVVKDPPRNLTVRVTGQPEHIGSLQKKPCELHVVAIGREAKGPCHPVHGLRVPPPVHGEHYGGKRPEVGCELDVACPVLRIEHPAYDEVDDLEKVLPV